MVVTTTAASNAPSFQLRSRRSSHSLAAPSLGVQHPKSFNACKGTRITQASGVATRIIRRAAAAVVEAETAKKKGSGSKYDIQTLTGWLLKQEQAGVIDAELTIVLSSISIACKQIAALVQRAGISNLTGVQGAVNVQGEDQKKLDVVSNEVFSSCLRSSGRTGIIASEEEDVPVAVEESYSGNYIAVFDPLDGSSNIDAAVSTGSIFGIYSPNDECIVDDSDDAIFIEEVMELLELTPLRAVLVGLPGVSGLSTEQHKRLTIAVELAANPSFIFMDEPTSGLDARAAAIVMRTVRNAVDTGRTVVCTVHQPSIEIFHDFDELLLLKRGGEEIYVGPLGHGSSHLIKYFEVRYSWDSGPGTVKLHLIYIRSLSSST